MSDNNKKDLDINQAKWYIVTSITGNEDAVYKNIEDKIRAYKLEEVVQEMRLLKTKEITIEIFDSINNPPPRVMRNSKTITWESLPGNRYKKTRIREINRFPGYIYIKMIMMADAWYIIRNTYGVTGFVGSSGKGAQPIPMSDEEVENLFNPNNNKDIIINKSDDQNIHLELNIEKTPNSEKKIEFLGSAIENMDNDGFFDSSLGDKKIEEKVITNELDFINKTPEEYLTNHEVEIENKLIQDDELNSSTNDIQFEGNHSKKYLDFSVGNTVEIISGAWEGSVGEIISINQKSNKAMISIEFLGRNNNIEIDFENIRKKI